MRKYFTRGFLWINIIVIFVCTPCYACTTLIIGKNASLEGHTIIARTSDTVDTRRAKNLKIYYDKNSLKSYIGLPYWDVEDDERNDMSQVTTNAYGLSLSATQTIRSKSTVLSLDPPSDPEKGVAEANIPSIIMPFATTARDGVDILGNAIEENGLADRKGFGVLFADKHEAWYLETLSGHQWVAIKIPEDVYFVAANGPGQIQEYSPKLYEYKMSHFQGKTPIQFALENNIAQMTNLGEFNFRETFADATNPNNPKKNYVRLAYIQHIFNPSSHKFDSGAITKGVFPMFLKPEIKISINDVKMILASHYQEYPEIDPYRFYNKESVSIDSYRAIASLHTSNAHVTIVDNTQSDSDANINNLEYIALGMPAISFYLPIYYGITEVPNPLQGATDKADLENENLFWQFRKLQALTFLSDPHKNIAYNPYETEQLIQKKYRELAGEIEKERLHMELKYKQTKNRKLIDKFMKKAVNQVGALNRRLIQEIMERLNISGKYAFKNEGEEANWFTEKVREQECHFKTHHCNN